MPEIEVNGRKATWREPDGPGPGVPVLFAHCSLAHSGLWKPILAELAPERRALAVDMPAHGRSDPPPEGMSLQMHAVDVCEALAERLAADSGGPIHLVGLSLGGAVLGRLALKRPDLVRSLVQIEPVWFFVLAEARRDETAGETEFNRKLRRVADEQGFDAAAEIFVGSWGQPGGWDALGPQGQAYAAHCLRYLLPDFPMISGRGPGQPSLAEIGAMRPPLTLIWGETTEPSAKAVIEVIGDAVPSARRVEIPEAGHLSPVERPDAVLAALREHFAAAEAPAAA